MTDTTTLAPTDAEIEDLLKSCGMCWAERSFWQIEDADLHPAIRAVLAKWGAPAPASNLEKAVRKLHAAKGRYHNQIAACDLYDLLGLPNFRPGQEPVPPAQEARVPLSDEKRREMWRVSTFRGNGGQIDWFIEGTRAAERAHGITAAQKETP